MRSLFIVLSFAALSSFGQEIVSNGLKYEVIDQSLKTVKTAYEGNVSSTGIFTIPSEIMDSDGASYKVVAVGAKSFLGAEVSEVIIPETVITIETAGFARCTALKEITLPASIESIGETAFGFCTSLSSLTLPDNLIKIPSYMLQGCTALKSLQIPESVTEIGHDAFKDTYLPPAILPKNLKSIPGNLFTDTRLKEIEIPYWIEKIDSLAFEDCKISSVQIPPSVSEIGKKAFSGNNLTEIALPPSIKVIGDQAFSNNKELTTVVIPQSVSTIGYASFGCRYGISTFVDYYGPDGMTWKDFYVPEFDNDCSIKEVYSISQTPPEIAGVAFFKVQPGCKLIVKEESIDQYRNKWQEAFSNDGKNEYHYSYSDLPDDVTITFRPFKDLGYEPLVMAESVALDCDRIEDPKEGDVFELKASVLPEDALQYVFFKSTNPEMATVTQDGVVTIKDPTVNPGDSGIGYCEVLVYSVYSEEPMAVCRIGDSTGVEQTVIGGDAPATATIDYSLPVEVYSLSGARVASSTEGLQPGVYIIRQGAATAKIAVR